jgi:uncharacterized membrane protein YfcA
MAIVYQRERGPDLRARLARLFGFGSVVSIVLLAAFGQIHAHDLAAAAVLLPGALGGFALSRHTAHRLDHGYVRHAVLAVSALSAVVTLVRALR